MKKYLMKMKTIRGIMLLLFLASMLIGAVAANAGSWLWYDDGTAQAFEPDTKVTATNYLRARFLLSDFGLSGGYLVETVQIYWADGTPYGVSTYTFEGEIKLRDVGGGPVTAASISDPLAGAWVNYDVSGAGFVSEDFFVEVWWTSGEAAMGCDGGGPNAYHSSDGGSTWSPFDPADGVGDLMIRVYVVPPPTGVIPEVPWGTVVATASMIIALAVYITVPRWRRKSEYINP